MKKCANEQTNEHASNASLNRLRGVRNARANKRREAKSERREARGRAPREVMCGAAARRESEAMRNKTIGERNARGEKNERREKVGCKEEEKALRPEQARRRAVRNGREESERESGRWSGEQPSTIPIHLFFKGATYLPIYNLFLGWSAT